MDPSDPAHWERLGFPLVTLILLGIAAFRIVRWFKPWVERVIEGHLSFIDRTQKLLEASMQEQKSQSAAMERLAENMRETRAETAELASNIVDRLDRMLERGLRS